MNQVCPFDVYLEQISRNSNFHPNRYLNLSSLSLLTRHTISEPRALRPSPVKTSTWSRNLDVFDHKLPPPLFNPSLSSLLFCLAPLLCLLSFYLIIHQSFRV